SLKHVTDAAVPQIEGLAVARVQLLHQAPDLKLIRLEQQVEVVRHQTVGAAPDREARADVGEPGQKALLVRSAQADLLTRVGARHHVIQGARNVDAEWASHDAWLRNRRSIARPKRQFEDFLDNLIVAMRIDHVRATRDRKNRLM